MVRGGKPSAGPRHHRGGQGAGRRLRGDRRGVVPPARLRWDGAPLSCAVGLAVLDVLRREGLVDHVRARGPRLRDQLADALKDVPMVREVRGHGFLLGVEYVDPNDGVSFLPPELRTAGRVDAVAFEQGLVILSTMPTRDGYAGDQSLFAPAFTASDAELAEMVERFAAAVRQVADEVSGRLKKPAAVS
ncbi:MAG: aminotransferase class III-fold pyridoxal phosphate-dependent enzyme [Chloroflexi bacterium]|nr:MAG: aminotransferase class III-fold pyridoxal phosphate-dependent enzyme [Chloroflexota bacterium]